MTSKVTIRDVPDDVECYTKVLDERRFILSSCGLIQGNCVSASMRTWFKMKNTPAIRVRGKRDREIELDKKEGRNDNYHFWVENKGMCFDLSGGIQQIYKKEDYYEQMRVWYSQEANVGRLFFSDEILDKNLKKLEKKMKDYDYLDRLIQIYEEADKI